MDKGRKLVGQPILAQITLTEVPVYGSGKLGLARPQLGGGFEYIYELTDHLGNVRATLKKDEDVYLATMEDNGQATMSNPRVVEMAQFKNLFETEKRDARMNKTAASADVPTPEWSAYLNWMDDGNPATKKDIIGPAIALKVERGDQINIEAWAKFEKQASYTRNATPAIMSTLLGGSFVNASFGLETLGAANQAFGNSLPVALAGTGSEPGLRPHAYLNYIVFDNSYILKDAGAMRVPEAAGFDPGMEITVAPQRVSFTLPIEPQQTGYIYVWVSNETQGSKVWWDDLKVTHEYSRVTQASDYYAFGSVLREQKSPDDLIYRYGYQGEYSEKDLETGWNHFELREYDPVIGRYLTIDPLSQYFSPYEAFGNNPINTLDPDGGYAVPPSVIFKSFLKAIYSRAENEAEFNFLTKVKGTRDMGVSIENIYEVVHAKYEAIGEVLFTLDGNEASAQIKWNGDSKAINSVQFTDKTLFGTGKLENAVLFYGGEGGLVGYMTFDSKSDYKNFTKGYKNYVNALLLDKVKSANVNEIGGESNRSEWIKYLTEQGLDINFRVDNIRDTPTLWERIKSIFTSPKSNE